MDKLAKVRAEVERLKGWNNNVRNSTRHMTLQEEDFNRGKHSSYLEILNFIDSLQEEPVKIKKGCKYRCLSDMINKDTGNISFIGGKIYLAPEDNTLVSEENGWRCDTSENASNFELIEEPISEDLGEAANKYAIESYPDEPSTGQFGTGDYESYVNMSGQRECAVEDFKAGAKWKEQQLEKDYTNLCNGIATAKGLAVAMAYDKGMADAREQMMSKAIVREVKVDAGGYPYIDTTELYDYDKDIPLAKERDKVKVIVIKEE